MAIHNVANAAQLQTALSRAVGGDKIMLAAGDYGSVAIHGRNYASNVTIQSANWTNKAHFDGLNMTNSSNIMFNGLDMGRGREAADAEFSPVNFVRNSINIRFNGVYFHGDRDGDPTDDLVGLSVYDSRGVKVTNSEFDDLGRGMYVLRSSDTQVVGNNFHDLRLDGICVAATNGIILHNNVFKDFHPVGDDHADAIQFWNTGQTRGSQNASIKNNVIWFPEDYADTLEGIQGIWVADPGAYGYQNFVIENNLVYSNDRWNGISVFGGRNIQVRNNTVLSSTDEDKVMWIRLENSTGVTMTGNVTEDMVIRNTNPAQYNNLDLSNTPHLRSLFANLVDPDSIQDLIIPGFGYRPTSILPAGTPLGDDDGATSSSFEVADISDIEIVQTVFEPLPVEETLAMVEALPTFSPSYSLYDSFTALP